jgi:hypothetical protein
MSDYAMACPQCGKRVKPYETEDYTAYVGYPAVHRCYEHCGAVWTHLHENRGKGYRALISVPLEAADDDDAWAQADRIAAAITDAGVIIGHTERVTRPGAVVYEDPGFRRLHGIPR